MTGNPIQISRLREIGWSKWDPIGLKDVVQQSDAVASEYDSYLLHVAGLLKRGHTEAEAIEYLLAIATKHMGLPIADRGAAESTVRAIKDYIESITSA
jgi:hypothetical protein